MSDRGIVRKKKRWGKVYEYTPTIRDAILSEDKAEEVENDIKNSSVITPQTLAAKHNIRVSLAKKILRKFEEDGEIELEYKNGDAVIYKN